MKRSLVYDLPTRFFHWFFSGCFVTAYFIAKTADDGSSLFPYHMLLGLSLGFVVILRILWGVFGTKHARFTSFPLRPGELFLYFKEVLTGGTRRWAGHNPASSWAGLLMMVLGLGAAVTGYSMVSGGEKENIEEFHEWFTNGFAIVALFHVAGIVVHTLRLKDWIGLSMITGKKAEVSQEESISSAKTGFGVAFLAIAIAFVVYLVSQYDSQKRRLNLFGTSLVLGEEQEVEEED